MPSITVFSNLLRLTLAVLTLSFSASIASHFFSFSASTTTAHTDSRATGSIDAIRILRLLPVLSSTVTLMFAVDEHIFLGTWMHPDLRDRANAHLPAWFTRWGRRGTWVILLGYPTNFALSVANLLVAREALRNAGATPWFQLGFLFSFAHIAVFGKRALGLLADIREDRPKGNSTYSMGVWLEMNWFRALVTDFPAWLFFIGGALKAL